MASSQARKLTITVPEECPPGTIMSIPISGLPDPMQVRVPDDMGPGSTLILMCQEGATEWSIEVGSIVAPVGTPGGTPVGAMFPGEDQYQMQQMQQAEQQQLQMQQMQQAEQQQLQMQQMQQEEMRRMQMQQEEAQRMQMQQEEARRMQMQQEEARRMQMQQEEARRMQMQQEQMQMQQIAPPESIPTNVIGTVAQAYTVRLETTVGIIDIIVRPDWAPQGARRFLELASSGDLDQLSFYRAIDGCIAQFGLPAKRRWDPIPDDPQTGVPFLLGAVSFAAVGENSRKSTLFICTGDMSHCLGQKSWEIPIGAVAETSLDVLDKIDCTYGDIAEFHGNGPDTSRINSEGNAYLRQAFPRLTYIVRACSLDWKQENPQDVNVQPPRSDNQMQQTLPRDPPQMAHSQMAHSYGIQQSLPAQDMQKPPQDVWMPIPAQDMQKPPQDAQSFEKARAMQQAEQAMREAEMAMKSAANATTVAEAQAAAEIAARAARVAQQAQQTALSAQNTFQTSSNRDELILSSSRLPNVGNSFVPTTPNTIQVQAPTSNIVPGFPSMPMGGSLRMSSVSNFPTMPQGGSMTFPVMPQGGSMTFPVGGESKLMTPKEFAMKTATANATSASELYAAYRQISGDNDKWLGLGQPTSEPKVIPQGFGTSQSGTSYNSGQSGMMGQGFASSGQSGMMGQGFASSGQSGMMGISNGQSISSGQSGMMGISNGQSGMMGISNGQSGYGMSNGISNGSSGLMTPQEYAASRATSAVEYYKAITANDPTRQITSSSSTSAPVASPYNQVSSNPQPVAASGFQGISNQLQQLGGSLNFSSIPAPISSVGPVIMPSSQSQRGVSQSNVLPVMPQGGSLTFSVTPPQASLLPTMPQGGSLTFPVTPAPAAVNGFTASALQPSGMYSLPPTQPQFSQLPASNQYLTQGKMPTSTAGSVAGSVAFGAVPPVSSSGVTVEIANYSRRS